jgi:hypothetical protein
MKAQCFHRIYRSLLLFAILGTSTTQANADFGDCVVHLEGRDGERRAGLSIRQRLFRQGWEQTFRSGSKSFEGNFTELGLNAESALFISRFGNPNYLLARLGAEAVMQEVGFSLPTAEDLWYYMSDASDDSRWDIVDWNDHMFSIGFSGTCDGVVVHLWKDTEFRSDFQSVSFEDTGAHLLSNIGWQGEVSSYKVLFPHPPGYPRTNNETIAYALDYPDLMMNFGANLAALREHYVVDGYFEGRTISPLGTCGDTGGLPELADRPFDPCWYLNNNTDVEKVMGDGDMGTVYTHFLAFGLDQGRQSNAGFSISAYRDRHPELYGHSYRAALAHWFRIGQAEGRNARP